MPAMFESEAPQANEKTDYTGLKIVAILAPVFFVFVYFGKAEMGFTAILVLGMIMLAVKLRWRQRKHLWFWPTIAIVLLLHLPLLFLIRWPETKIPTIAYSMPLAILDFLLIMGTLTLAENLFSRDAPSDDSAGRLEGRGSP